MHVKLPVITFMKVAVTMLGTVYGRASNHTFEQI